MGDSTEILCAEDLVLFQGDSITNAFRKPEERNDAYQMGSGYALMIAAVLQADPAWGRLRCLNRGVSGNRLADLAARWDEDTIALCPNRLSLLVGTNDIICDARDRTVNSVEHFAAGYTALLERTRRSLPQVTCILLEPFMLPGSEVTSSMLDILPGYQRSIAEIARRSNSLFIPLQEEMTQAARGCESAWMYDGIHPTARGHWLVASRWLEIVAGAGLRQGV